MPTAMRTLVFEIHDPSRKTRTTLMRALRSYTAATTTLLDAARRDWATLRAESLYKEKLSEKGLAAAMNRRYGVRLRRYPLHSSAYDAALADVAASLCSYDKLLGAWEGNRAETDARIAERGWPLAPKMHKNAEKALAALGEPPSWPTTPRTCGRPRLHEDTLAHVTQTIPPEGIATKRRLGRRDPTWRLRRRLSIGVTPWTTAPVTRGLRLEHLLKTQTRPIFFSRADGKRNFALLRSEEDGRYYVLLYLLPGGDGRRAPAWPATPTITAPVAQRERALKKQTRNRRGALQVMYPKASALSRNDRTGTALCLPLACGWWHETGQRRRRDAERRGEGQPQTEGILRQAVLHPEMVRTARLVHRAAHKDTKGTLRPEQFFLAVTFAVPCPESRAIRTSMGISMDADGHLAFAVCDPQTGSVLEAGDDRDLFPPDGEGYRTLTDLQREWRENRRFAMRQGRLSPRAHHLQAEQVKHATHVLAKALVAVATSHDAQIAIEDVSYLRDARPIPPRDETGKRLPRSEASRNAERDAQYCRATLVSGTLTRLIAQKGERDGVPEPLTVGGISPRDCAACGQRGENPDGQKRMEVCPICGTVLGVRNTAIVVARRVSDILARKADAARKRKEREDATRDPAPDAPNGE